MKNEKLTVLLEDMDFLVTHCKNHSVEIETWTMGGVNMVIYLDTFSLESFCDYVDSFDIDEEIEIHREGKDYCKAFTISESLKDFTKFAERLKAARDKIMESFDNKKTYTVKTKFVFSGEFYVPASSKAEAILLVEQHCGLRLGGDIHASIEEIDWEFDSCPEKIISKR